MHDRFSLAIRETNYHFVFIIIIIQSTVIHEKRFYAVYGSQPGFIGEVD